MRQNDSFHSDSFCSNSDQHKATKETMIRRMMMVHAGKHVCYIRQISLAWRNIKKNRRTIGLLSLDNWCGVNLWCNKSELSALDGSRDLLYLPMATIGWFSVCLVHNLLQNQE